MQTTVGQQALYLEQDLCRMTFLKGTRMHTATLNGASKYIVAIGEERAVRLPHNWFTLFESESIPEDKNMYLY